MLKPTMWSKWSPCLWDKRCTTAACQAHAAINGRGYVLPDDVKALAVPALAHRLTVDPGARLRGVTAAGIVEEILDRIAVPIED